MGLAWFSDEITAGPAVLLAIVLLAALWYALTALRARSIVGWALSRTSGSLRLLLPMTTRALPLLLLAITFLFINTEMWQVGGNLTVGSLWLVVLLFAALAVGFLFVRLPEEVDRADDDVDDAFLLRTCARTPARRRLPRAGRRPGGRPGVVRRGHRLRALEPDPGADHRPARAGAAAVAVGLRVPDALRHPDHERQRDGRLADRPGPFNTSRALVQVSTFLAAFSGLYLTVSTVTDEAYREQFFGSVMRELERAVGVRAVYLALRARGS